MSTFPIISHHLFVAAAGQSSRTELKALRAGGRQSDPRRAYGPVRVEMPDVNNSRQETGRPLRVLECATTS
jgi:hypothetical protein